MAIHRLNDVTIGVPDPATTGVFYREFGLTETAPDTFASTDGGDQLHLVTAPKRKVIDVGLGCADPDDLDRLAANVNALDLGPGIEAHVAGDRLQVHDPGTDVTFTVTVAEPLVLTPRTQALYNAPGAYERMTARADGILREDQVRPRKLSHVVLGSLDAAATQRLLVDGLGFKVSDEVAHVGAFLRCSSEHHNILVQNAPVPFLHHSSWQVDDVDEIGRGAAAMLATDPSRHIWGLGRHFIGSNFFWYLKDPAGNFAEYSSDIDVIVDDELWKPEVWGGMRSLMAWGPTVPASFIAPDDLAELMAP